MTSSTPPPHHGRCCHRSELQLNHNTTSRLRRLRFPTASTSPPLLGAHLESTSRYERNATKYWEQFYSRHHNKFFKDRHYLEKDWGHYFSLGSENWCGSGGATKSKVVLEVGCGAGNTLFPLLDAFPDIFIHACDFSPRAVSLVKANGAFKPERVNAFLCDATVDDLSKEISPSSVDAVTLIFMLSAVSPKKMHVILKNIRRVLKPNGYVLLRDYAIGDFAQEKLADKNQMLSENFYVRGDGTCAFYFSEESLSGLFERCGFYAKEINIYSKQIENRFRKVVMERRWIRGIFCHSVDYPVTKL